MQKGHIFKRGNSWLVQYWQPGVDGNGQVIRKRVAQTIPNSSECKTEGEARRLAQKEILADLNKQTRPESIQSLADFLELIYLPHCKAEVKPSTYKAYSDFHKLVKPHLGDARLNSFEIKDADRLLQAVANTKPLAHTTLRNVKAFLSGAFRYARREGLLANNNDPISDAKIPRGLAKRDTPAYTLPEITAMLKILPEPARTCVLTAALTGLRMGEIKGLKWTDFTGDTLLVNRAVWSGHVTDPKSLSSRAPIPLVPMVVKALKQHRKRTTGDDYVFHGITNQPLRLENVARHDIIPALDKASIPWHGWHAFRRGVATNLHTLGVPIQTIANVLRHSDTKVTEAMYVRPVAKESKRAMRLLERTLIRK